MFILLDENLLSKKLKKPLVDAGHFVQNVEEMGWRGVKDRELIALAQAHPFDVFITADKNLPYQQNLHGLSNNTLKQQRLKLLLLRAYLIYKRCHQVEPGKLYKYKCDFKFRLQEYLQLVNYNYNLIPNYSFTGAIHFFTCLKRSPRLPRAVDIK